MQRCVPQCHLGRRDEMRTWLIDSLTRERMTLRLSEDTLLDLLDLLDLTLAPAPANS